MRKIIFVLIVLLLLAPSVLGFQDLFKNECSTTSTDYRYYNDTAGSITSTVDININDIDLASKRIFTVQLINLKWDTSTITDHPRIYLQDDSNNFITRVHASSLSPDGIWYYQEGGGLVGWAGVNSVQDINYNLSFVVSLGTSNVTNFTITNKTTQNNASNIDNLAERDFGEIRIYRGEGTITWDGVYVYNGTTCPAGTPPSSSSLNMSSTPLPIQNHTFSNTTGAFSINVNSTTTFGCTLNINKTINQTKSSLAAGTNIQPAFNVTFGSGEFKFNYTINCSGSDGNKQNSSSFDFFADDVLPVITWANPHTANSTIVVVSNNATFTTNINISDTNLYSYYLNFTTGNNNSVKFNYTNTSVKGSASINLWEKLNLTSLAGTMTATLKVCDGHTSNYISLSPPEINKNELNFDSVQILTSDVNDVPSYKKSTDRYSFIFSSLSATNTKRFTIKSNDYIDIIENSKYKGHLIINDKWVDFEAPFINSVVVNRVSWNEVTVDVTAKYSLSKWEFNSIGEINCITQNKKFFLLTTSETYEENVLSQQFTTFVLNISYDKDFITEINATLNYNNTVYAVNSTNYTTFFLYSYTLQTPEINTNSTNITFYWNYSVNNVKYNTSFKNQSVYKALIDNCTISQNYIINFTIKDDVNNSARIGSLSIYNEWQIGNTIYNYSKAFIGSSTYALCLFPLFGNISLDSQMSYTSDGYSNKTYYLVDYLADNVTDLIDLYLTTGTTLVQFRVTDFNDIAVENAYIKVLRYDLPTNTYRTIEILKSDSEGYAYGNIILNIQDYKFIVDYNGVTKLITEPTRITSTTKRFRINLGTEIFGNYNDISNIGFTPITFNNATKSFSMTYASSSGSSSEVCMSLIKRTTNGDIDLGTNCVISAGATVTNNITGSVGSNTYIATAYTVITENNYFLDDETVSFDKEYKTFGKSGIFFTAMMVIGIVGIFVWNPVGAIVGAVLVLCLSIILKIFFVSFTTIVVIIIIGVITIYRLRN